MERQELDELGPLTRSERDAESGRGSATTAAAEVPLDRRRRSCRHWSTATTVGSLAAVAAVALVIRAGFFRNASVESQPRVEGLVAFPRETPKKNGETSWEGHSCFKGCGKAGYCSWCGRGMACCQANDANSPLECRGIGSWNYLSCAAVVAGENDQCGGAEWQGAQKCGHGLECVKVDESYSECRRYMQTELAPAYRPCLWVDEGTGNEEEAMCVKGTICREISGIPGFSKRLCLPPGLLNPGANCLEACGGAGGTCESFCGRGNACCQASNENDPYECRGAVGFLTSHHECIVPARAAQIATNGLGTLGRFSSVGEPAPSVGRSDVPVEIKHWGQPCLKHCVQPGACDWCGTGNACCAKGAHNDPPECVGVTIFGDAVKHTCVKPVAPVGVYHQGQNCWLHCKKSGYCDWCGIGNACCKEGAAWQPQECQGVTDFPTKLFHTCVQAVPGTAGACYPGTERNAQGDCVKPAAPTPFTFYMYHASSGASPTNDGENTNMASLAGVLWYLHNEILVSCPRRYNISKIKRFRVTMKPTQQLYFATKRNFGPYSAFDYGKCTAPDCDQAWGKYGYVVGCQQLSTSVAAYSPNPTLYSLPGACPDAVWPDKTQACKEQQVGGACASAAEVGTGACTYHAEPAGEVDISELAGISDYDDFCARGNSEYVPDWDAGRGATFWDRKMDPRRCAERIEALQTRFRTQFGTMPTSYGEPLCDSSST
eukprot:TRINITY_DN47153_c0_g1_i1.p1 TRINITY_DN47153_c0_g1~~TRINITY_DN47153_c0_g1_i1.p1  ORF type:complete len:747 (+),score=125.56 TRINITY_DN47153_c0_g1_i1:91-2241(+)